MNDCVNGDIRDVLPELVSGTLPAGDAARVQDHVRGCVDCAAEVELLRTARAAMRLAPMMDTVRIASAVQASTAQRLAARRVPARVARTARMAGVSLIVALGAVGLWVSRDSSSPAPAVIAADAGVAHSGGEQAAVPASAVGSRVVQGPVQLALGGDISQLADDQLLALLDEVAEFDAMPGEEPTSLSMEPVLPLDQEDLR